MNHGTDYIGLITEQGPSVLAVGAGSCCSGFFLSSRLTVALLLCDGSI